MKKLLLFTTCSMVFQLACYNQAIDWKWGQGSIGPLLEEGWAVSTDGGGNAFITGAFYGDSMMFPGVVLYKEGAAISSNMYLAKYSPAGHIRWGQAAIFTDVALGHYIKSNSVAGDAAGNAYVTGAFSGNGIMLGAQSLTWDGQPESSFFIARYDSSGTPLWVSSASAASSSEGECIATDNSGNIYVAGSFSGDSINLDGITLHAPAGNANDAKIFIAKYDAGGNIIWAAGPADGTGYSIPQSITTDIQNNVYITGNYDNGTITFGNTVLNSNGGDYGFLAKYDSAGNALWAKNIASNETSVSGVSAADRYVYITGQFRNNTVTFGSIVWYDNNYYVNNLGSYFIAAYDTGGNALWANGPTNNSGDTVMLSYVAAVNINGVVNVYAAIGYYGDSISYDSATLYSPVGKIDPVAVLALDSSGRMLCSATVASGSDDQFGLSVDKNGNGYLCSDYYCPGPFIFGPDTLYDSTNVELVYAARFNCPACGAAGSNFTYQLSQPGLCNGDSAIITLSGDSDFSISPVGDARWIDSLHAILKPDTTTLFTVSAHAICGVPQLQTFTLQVISDTVSISANKLLICAGDTAQICAPAGLLAYSWNNGNTTACISAANAGDYYVTVTENGNCQATSNHIGINTYPPTTVATNQFGDTLQGFDAVTYQWLLNDTIIPAATGSIFIAQAPGSYTLQITDSNGCTETSNPIVISGISNVSSENGITVFPNPANSGWQLNVSGEWTGSMVEVFDATGRSIFKSVITNQHSLIEITGLASGVYELRITQPGYSAVKKLIKM